MGCQREIARKIPNRKTDDILALQGNLDALRDDVEFS
jgi:hypothetical protein